MTDPCEEWTTTAFSLCKLLYKGHAPEPHSRFGFWVLCFRNTLFGMCTANFCLLLLQCLVGFTPLYRNFWHPLAQRFLAQLCPVDTMSPWESFFIFVITFFVSRFPFWLFLEISTFLLTLPFCSGLSSALSVRSFSRLITAVSSSLSGHSNIAAISDSDVSSASADSNCGLSHAL